MYSLLSVSPYPDSAVSAGELAFIAIVPVLAMVAWLIVVFVAGRQQRQHSAAGTTQQERAQEELLEQPKEKLEQSQHRTAA